MKHTKTTWKIYLTNIVNSNKVCLVEHYKMANLLLSGSPDYTIFSQKSIIKLITNNIAY